MLPAGHSSCSSPSTRNRSPLKSASSRFEDSIGKVPIRKTRDERAIYPKLRGLRLRVKHAGPQPLTTRHRSEVLPCDDRPIFQSSGPRSHVRSGRARQQAAILPLTSAFVRRSNIMKKLGVRPSITRCVGSLVEECPRLDPLSVILSKSLSPRQPRARRFQPALAHPSRGLSVRAEQSGHTRADRLESTGTDTVADSETKRVDKQRVSRPLR